MLLEARVTDRNAWWVLRTQEMLKSAFRWLFMKEEGQAQSEFVDAHSSIFPSEEKKKLETSKKHCYL